MQISESVLNLLDFYKSLYPFAENLRGGPGEQALASLSFCKTPEQLEERYRLLKAWGDCVDRYGDNAVPWDAAVVCVSAFFPAAKKSGMFSGEELLKIRSLLTLAARVREALQNLRSTYPLFETLERRLRDFTPELETLSVVEDSGRLADNASPKLQDIRGELESLKRAARKTASRMMENPSVLNMLQERSLIWRGGRFLLLVRQEYINRFPGLTVDRSGSGNSVYMEPRILSSVNSRLLIQAREEEDEERRVLMEITRKILGRGRAIAESETVLGEIDLLHAAREVMRKQRWTCPEITRKSAFNLAGARHPLLKEAAVPVDIRCGGAFSSLVITGPNTGGKTVVLKTAGLCVALAWAGLPLPARDGSSVGNFDAIYADVGDEQSIEQNLSTFSAHLKNIVSILKAVGPETEGPKSLVLLDELGAGTDPQEGAALGIAILETLKNSRALTLATTHHNPVKQYALTTASVETASMEFDIDRLAPTYRLLMGVPGKSNALLIAYRWGMPESVLELARNALAAREVSAEELMGELNERRAALDREERRLAEERAETERLKKMYKERAAEIDSRKDQIIEAADRRASDILARAEAASRDLMRGLDAAAKSAARQEWQKRRPDIQNIRKGLDTRQAGRVARDMENRPKTFVPEAGATVQVAGSSIVGIIESVKNGYARLVAGSMHLDVPLEQLVQTAKTAKIATPPVDTSTIMKREHVPSSLMVRGMTVDEALPLVSVWLDRAYRGGYSSVLIIHGRGEGILRREIHALCARLKYVEEYRLGDAGEGGYGVTVVSFAR